MIDAILGFIQESKAEAALEGLRSMVRTDAKVVRGGIERTVASDELVPGDLVLLEAGDKVPADLRLTRMAELPGERVSADRGTSTGGQGRDLLAETIPAADRHNMAYSGTCHHGQWCRYRGRHRRGNRVGRDPPAG